MTLCVCKCLNVTIESDKIEDNVDLGKLELTFTEQRDIFEPLLLCPANALKITVIQLALTGQRTVGRWTLHSCLACGHNTHAFFQDGPNSVFIWKSNKTTPEAILQLKKSSNFSPVFNLLIPEPNNDIEMKENIDTNNVSFGEVATWSLHNVIGDLKKHLNQSLQSQLEAVEDSVRQYRDQKYTEFELYKDRAQRDHKILASIISKAHRNLDNDGWGTDLSQDNGPLSPQLPPLQRRRLSSLKDAKKIPHVTKTNRNIPPEEDSLDAEDIFDIEGMDSRNTMASDQDDYDSGSEESEGNEGGNEGIHIAQVRKPDSLDFARSLPINMPNVPGARHVSREQLDDEEPKDIAASIKALARSVHGDVFELPRPRFSTQI